MVKAPGKAAPEHTIVALYMRQQPPDLEFRLDLLEMTDPLSNNVYLALDMLPGGNNALPNGQKTDLKWDVLLVLPATDPPYALSSNGQRIPGLVPRIVRNPVLDTIVVLVNTSALPGNPNRLYVQAFLTEIDSELTYDQTPPLAAGEPESISAPLFLEFWDTLPAQTPAQALRRWDGAHTGPYGRRHGLSILLQEASNREVPISLLDLKTLDSLSALDLVQGTRWVQKLEASGLVSLPLTAFGDTASSLLSLKNSRDAAQDFGLMDSPFGYGPFNTNLPPGFRAVFYATNAENQVLSWKGVRLIPLASANQLKPLQADENGPSIEFKKKLLDAALSGKDSIVVMGGALPESSLADSAIAPLFFEYIATHPWIHALPASELLTYPAKEVASLPTSTCQNILCADTSDGQPVYNSQGKQTALTAAQIRTQLHSQLSSLPPSNVQNMAWQAYLQLSAQKSWIDDPSIQANYIGQVGNLIAAARWLQNPAAKTDCSTDINWDEQPDCILASPDLFAILEPDGGRLAFLASRSGAALTQWVGLRSQFAMDLENPHMGPPAAGLLRDPSEIPGALFDNTSFSVYQAKASPGKIVLINTGLSIQKTFSLDGKSLHVQIQTGAPYRTSIPVTLDPEGRYAPGWAQTYPQAVLDANTWSWVSPGQSGIRISSDKARFTARSFLDSVQFMDQPENPDRAYPPGHYTPFPLAVLNVQADSSFELRLSISP